LEASRKLRRSGIEVPYPLPPPTEETKWKVAFEAPSDITLVGSWANKVSVKAKDERKYGVDVAVEMPSVCIDISKRKSVFLIRECRNFFKKRITSMGVSFTNEHTIWLSLSRPFVNLILSKSMLNINLKEKTPD
jgi:hypothetical protein